MSRPRIGILVVAYNAVSTLGDTLDRIPEEFWPSIVDGGVYLVEDLHTSYWTRYGGGFKRPGTFIEYAKNLVDQQNAWHSRDAESFTVDDYTRTIRGMHVYDSVIVFDKAAVPQPTRSRTGTPSW